MQASIHERERAYEALMARWGYSIEHERATIEFLLRALRHHFGWSLVTQRCCFRMSALDFRRLQRMDRPRNEQFAADILHIAHLCNIGDVENFCAAMEHARQLVELEAADVLVCD